MPKGNQSASSNLVIPAILQSQPLTTSLKFLTGRPANPTSVMPPSASVSHRPLLILHRLIRYDALNPFPFIHSAYTVLDPLADPVDPSFPVLSRSARLLLCVGLAPLTAADLDRYPSVECVVGSSAGTDHFDLDACRRRGIRVTSAGDVFSDDVADCAVGLTIDVLRRISAADRFVRTGSWPTRTEYALGSKVSKKRVGIVGLGSIGLRVAKRFKAFNCYVSYTSRKMKSYIPYPFHSNVIDLALNVDVLILFCALTNETRHMINNTVMRALGKSGVIINIGRGALIDEKELVGFLVRGDISGAGLDVFENEPQVPEELFKLDNVVMAPHRGALTLESMASLQRLVQSNLKSFYANEPLQAEVEFN